MALYCMICMLLLTLGLLCLYSSQTLHNFLVFIINQESLLWFRLYKVVFWSMCTLFTYRWRAKKSYVKSVFLARFKAVLISSTAWASSIIFSSRSTKDIKE